MEPKRRLDPFSFPPACLSAMKSPMEYLIPESLFENASTLLLLVYIAVAVFLLAKGADLFVESAVAFAERFRVPKVIIGATLLSLGTTTPEAAVSVIAAFKGMPEFALGNSVGSIICDTGLIFGLSCLLTRLPVDRFILNRHGWLQFGSGLLLLLVCLLFVQPDGSRVIPQYMGYVFILLLIGYLLLSVYWAKRHDTHVAEEVHDHTGEPLTKYAFFMLGGLVMILIGSHVMIESVKVICHRFHVPEGIVAATLIAFGTSLPELVTALTCIKKRHTELLVGNIIGADILNVLFVTGAAAIASPLVVEPLFLTLHLPVMIAVLLVFRVVSMFAKETFPRWPGVVLLLIFAAYLGKNVQIASAQSTAPGASAHAAP